MTSAYRNLTVTVLCSLLAIPVIAQVERPPTGGGGVEVAGPVPTAAELTQEMSRALRRLLSSKEKERRSGERALRRIGAPAIAPLRAWRRKEGQRIERVDLVVDRILEDLDGRSEVPDPLSRSFSAETYFERKYEEARAELRHGRYEKARRIAEAIIELDPESPQRFRLSRLVRECKQRQMQKKLEPRVDCNELVFEKSDKPELHFRLYNRSGRRAKISIENAVFGELFVQNEQRFQFGNGTRETHRFPLRIDKERALIELEPGQYWEFELDQEIVGALPFRDFVGRWSVSAVFRPTLWEIDGDPDSNIPLRSDRTEFWIVPPGLKKLSKRPIESLTTAGLLRRGEDFLVAGWICVWGGEKDRLLNGQVIRTLIDQIEELPSGMQKVADSLLETATGKRHEKPADWVRWWKKRAARLADKAAPAVVFPSASN